jgi:hypothetical protein
MRVDYYGLRAFADVFAVPASYLHGHWNLQHYTLTAPAICWIGIRHWSTKVPITIPYEVRKNLRRAEAECDFVTSVAWLRAEPSLPAIRNREC